MPTGPKITKMTVMTVLNDLIVIERVMYELSDQSAN